MTAARGRRALPWLAIMLVGLAAAALRYQVVEPNQIGAWCSAGDAPAWCAWRHALVSGFLNYSYGYAALAAVLPALLWRHPAPAWLAAALGAFALQLYCVEAGALALLVGSLRLLRCQAATLPSTAQHRDGQGQVQTQP